MVCIIIYVSLAISRHWSTSACDGHRCITSEAFDISSRWSNRQSLRFDDFPLTDLEDLPTDMKSMAFTPYYWMVCRGLQDLDFCLTKGAVQKMADVRER